MKFIKWFNEITIHDVSLVGGKNASLGEMISNLKDKQIRIPNGFAVTSEAYWHFIYKNNIYDEMKKLILNLRHYRNIHELETISHKIRRLINKQAIPTDLESEIIIAYKKLSDEYKQKYCDVAVRSSATSEDLPTASFAGQQESFLNIKGPKELLNSYKQCLSSLFTPRAIVYRIEKGFDHFKVALSVGIQKMIRSDNASAGVVFTLDPDTGFKDVIFINSSYGLGESVVSGSVDPDNFYVHKPTLKLGFKPILKKSLGTKQTKVIYSKNLRKSTRELKVPLTEREQFSLNNHEILELAEMCQIIEAYYSSLHNKWTPMDIEWAKDGIDQKLYIVQARYETVYANLNNKNTLKKYILKENDQRKLKQLLLLTGQAVGQKISSGQVKVVKNISGIKNIKEGDIIVTTMTNPDWVPVMKKAAGIITDQGGRTCHAAIVSRELGIPAIVGTQNATSIIKTGELITIDCSQGQVGYIYKTALPFEPKEINLSSIKKPQAEIMLNIGNPSQAFAQSFLPVDGVGLARTEFVIANDIKIHPMALVKFDEIKDRKIRKEINKITISYKNKQDFFVNKLAENAGTIVAAFYPKQVLVRLSDFKSNEYRNLIGGNYFEPHEENPMLGLRGASRYYSKIYQDAFALECKAMKKIRDEMGLINAKIMIPFVRTMEEAKKVLELMKEFGLEREKNGLEIIMMCEIPSNVILLDQFSKYFDGFSIGSNDLTQFTLAIDRDSPFLTSLFDERNEAVKKLMKLAIEQSKQNNRKIGICGQGPSDYPDLVKFLVGCNIDSISFNADAIINFYL